MSSRLLMLIRSIAVLLAASAAQPGTAQATTGDGGGYPPDTVLLFVAGWCAPCRAEVARLDAIAAAARPRAVRVVLIDESAAGREMVRGLAAERRWRPDPVALRRVRATVFAATGGLPYSLVADAAGNPCADRRDGLDAARTRLLVAQCAARPRQAAP